MTVLLTGFTPFVDQPVNPSQLIVEALEDRPDVTGVVLPTVYQIASEQLVRHINDEQPIALLMLGLAGRRSTINLERFALNIDDTATPDNGGEVRQGQPIVPDGPAAYSSTLPLEALRQALHAREIPVTISNHAGAFVCNHLFYVARHALNESKRTIPCGFMHVPGIDGEQGLPLPTLIDAVAICLDVLTS